MKTSDIVMFQRHDETHQTVLQTNTRKTIQHQRTQGKRENEYCTSYDRIVADRET